MTDLNARLAAQRAAFAVEPWPVLAERRSRLDRLDALTREHEDAIVAAIDQDFGGRSAHETRLAELFVVSGAIRHARSYLKRWTRTRAVPTALQFRPAYNRLMPQPLGVVGIVSPWNYPFQLALGPCVAALAAGNRVMLKPSELTPHFSALLERLVARYFDATEVDVVTGGAEVGRAFPALPFDHLFFTGSTTIGREVAKAAAANLTPVTLELGGKSPAIIDDSADIAQAAGRIAFAKLLNAGQTCVAPDYLLVPRGRGREVANAIVAAVRRLYPAMPETPDYSAIISPRHRGRLAAMVEDARAHGAEVVTIGEGAEAGAKFPPTLLLGATRAMQAMQEEIFGPVLPIVEYDGIDAAIAHVTAGDRPLALYWFGSDAARRDRILRETHAGGVTINDCLWHLVQEEQPFGGVGASGIGAYHGEWGFRTFSHLKPVFHQSRIAGTALFRPPYGTGFERLLGLLRRM
ncbi:aldehyde dehydrogenase [Sphingomonas sp. Leaf23]|uniref:coniferyl aldehyde dehydrogenase n=1 Tax=Sphingomonas sp. Leaf23 TaxID=1735689 RepID=UPI00070192D2|nr:coniferyl aldehyde dehydrogenase [Sphingomonas sp. Leaf23]KQM85161.1 aldehyde dehydrogenase [Sphingomonas sp. Leaf23]